MDNFTLPFAVPLLASLCCLSVAVVALWQVRRSRFPDTNIDQGGSEDLTQGIVMINASYTIVATNDAAAELFGIRGLSLRGLGVETILPGITGALKNSLSSGSGIHTVEENFILGGV